MGIYPVTSAAAPRYDTGGMSLLPAVICCRGPFLPINFLLEPPMKKYILIAALTLSTGFAMAQAMAKDGVMMKQ